MLDMVYGWVEYLNDPIHVANIQRYFGVKRAEKSKANGKLKAPSPSSSGDESSSSATECDTCSISNEEYVVTNAYWFWLFKFGSSLGDEIFYASVFPFWFWNIDGAVGRRIITVWALSMFIGQSLKDVICWPRPRCPPVIRMQSKCALEYGMPSTHAMVSVTVPFSIILLTMNRYEYPVYLGLIAALVWCVLVSTSRLYLGMHSVADIVGGLALAIALLPVLLPVVDALDPFLLTHPAAPGVLLATTLALMFLYPKSKFSSAREDTAVIMGCFLGLHFGAWLSFQMGFIRGPPVPPPYSIIWPSYEMLGVCLLRTIIGLITVVATRALVKSAAYTVVKTVFSKDNKEDGGIIRDRDLNVKIVVKLVTYASVGLNVIWFAPTVFRMLNIERPTFHTEI